jgi:hypothetical protein
MLSGGTDWKVNSEILTDSRSRGAFAGSPSMAPWLRSPRLDACDL